MVGSQSESQRRNSRKTFFAAKLEADIENDGAEKGLALVAAANNGDKV